MKKSIFKALSAVICLSVIFALVLLPLLQIQFNITTTSDVDFNASVDAKWIYKFVKDKDTGNTELNSYLKSAEGVDVWSNLGALKLRVAVLMVSVALCVLIALAVLVIVFVLKKNNKLCTLVLASTGFMSALTASATLASISADLLNGIVKLTDLLGLGSLVSSFINLDLKIFRMGSAIPAIIAVFGALIVCSLAFMLLDFLEERAADKKKKQQKTAKRAAGMKNAKRR